jgi:hypothetical protein
VIALFVIDIVQLLLFSKVNRNMLQLQLAQRSFASKISLLSGGIVTLQR